MSEYPEDIMNAADECLSNFDGDYSERWKDHIAAAILAERERCAKICGERGYKSTAAIILEGVEQ